MNVLFLSLYEIKDTDAGYIYADLVKEFAAHNHKVYAVSPTRSGKTEAFTDGNGVTVIRVKNGQIQKTGRIKKVLNLLSLENKTIKAVKNSAKNVKFDLVVNMCSNLSLYKTMRYFKKRDNCTAYLLLKDIFPQNAVDIGMMGTGGLMGIVYRHFRRKERKAYACADFIGCMSKANCDFVIKHNPEVDGSKLTVVPNSIQPRDVTLTDAEKAEMREKYALPQDRTLFVYGGNLGKPQDIPFIIRCLKSQKENKKIHFFIVGDGTEYSVLQSFVENEKQENVTLMQRLPREDFDAMLAACDVGMIFLDSRFTVPNYPSRLLSYMQAGLPVLACTDLNTDVGKDIVGNGFGWWCGGNDVEKFAETAEEVLRADLKALGANSRKYLDKAFSVSVSYDLIMGCFDSENS